MKKTGIGSQTKEFSLAETGETQETGSQPLKLESGSLERT